MPTRDKTLVFVTWSCQVIHSAFALGASTQSRTHTVILVSAMCFPTLSLHYAVAALPIMFSSVSKEKTTSGVEVGELVFHFQRVVNKGNCRGGVDILDHSWLQFLMVRASMSHWKASLQWAATSCIEWLVERIAQEQGEDDKECWRQDALLIWKGSENDPFYWTASVMPLWNDMIVFRSSWRHPNLSRRVTRSKALDKLTKTSYKGPSVHGTSVAAAWWKTLCRLLTVSAEARIVTLG